VTVRLAPSATALWDDAPRPEGTPSWRCALVNNMPDGAFDATERQYLDLLNEGSGSEVIEVRRCTMAGVPRGDKTSSRIAEQFSPLESIYDDPPNLLIVTGSNPIERHIQDETYWPDLVELLSWGRTHVRSMLLSCLAAHAAATVFDDIPRVNLLSKHTGVFSQAVKPGHPLNAGVESVILLPHSRWNTVPTEQLVHAGYEAAVESDDGWAIVTRDEVNCQLVLVQGHPEYDPSSLLREYRRDAGRYVHHEREELPYLPFHCVSAEDWPALQLLHHQIITGQRDPILIDSYPFDEVGARAPWPWHDMAIRFYANWLSRAKPREDPVDAR